MMTPSRSRAAAALLTLTFAAVASGQTAPRSPEALYTQLCASCHGADHRGGSASSLADGVWRYGGEPDQIFRNIKEGITTMGMPAYEGAISDEETRALVEHLRALEGQERVAPQPLPDAVETRLHDYRVELVADGLEIPWAIDWLPDGRGLITEKVGRLRLLVGGKLDPRPIEGIPEVLVQGQGGLMDVAVDHDYAEPGNGWVYLAYTHGLPGGEKRAMTRIVRGRIDGHTWTDEQVLWEARPEHYLPARVHFGCRIVFDDHGHLFFAIGDRGRQDLAQDITWPNGKVHRIGKDGAIPRDNPFVDRSDAYPSIYTYGNRNPQGLAIHPTTRELWETEHGPRGGDELNLIEKGNNYGWPVITYGINYNGTPITDKTEAPGMEQPVRQWTPSIAVCGLDFYTGDRFDRWTGDLLVGALAFEEVRRVRLEGHEVADEEVILKGRGRVRDVNSGPDGYIYVVLNRPDEVVRLAPTR